MPDTLPHQPPFAGSLHRLGTESVQIRQDVAMPQFALSAIGRDRPGIVAEVTRALLGHSLNITDSQMAVLSGHFTMMLVVTAPEGTDLDAVEEELARTRDRLSLDALSLSPLGDADAAVLAPSQIVSVYGVDHPGIVHAVTARLAAREVNVTDLETRLIGEGGQAGLYAMVLEVALPAGMKPDALRAMLDEVGAEQGVDVTVRSLEPDVM
jgi:glycine cleavage system transcriptional repressor